MTSHDLELVCGRNGTLQLNLSFAGFLIVYIKVWQPKSCIMKAVKPCLHKRRRYAHRQKTGKRKYKLVIELWQNQHKALWQNEFLNFIVRQRLRKVCLLGYRSLSDRPITRQTSESIIIIAYFTCPYHIP